MGVLYQTLLYVAAKITGYLIAQDANRIHSRRASQTIKTCAYLTLVELTGAHRIGTISQGGKVMNVKAPIILLSKITMICRMSPVGPAPSTPPMESGCEANSKVCDKIAKRICNKSSWKGSSETYNKFNCIGAPGSTALESWPFPLSQFVTMEYNCVQGVPPATESSLY